MTRKAPALADVSVFRRWGGMYDVAPDHIPLVGSTGQLDGWWQANGWSGRGMLLAPYLTELLAERFVTGRTPAHLGAFDLTGSSPTPRRRISRPITAPGTRIAERRTRSVRCVAARIGDLGSTIARVIDDRSEPLSEPRRARAPGDRFPIEKADRRGYAVGGRP
jgi:hypothetical protein